MGRRIGRYLGYGVQDLHLIKGRVVDPRVDVKALKSWRPTEHSANEFLKFVETDQGLKRLLQREFVGAVGDRAKESVPEDGSYQRPILLIRQLQDIVSGKLKDRSTYLHHHIDEDSDLKVLLIQEPYDKEWSRRDDLIDYSEAVNSKPSVKVLGGSGITPYNGRLVRTRAPTDHVRAFLKGRLMWNDRFLDPPVARLLQKYHPEGDLTKDKEVVKHFREDYRPLLPAPIIAVMAFTGAFPDMLGPEGIGMNMRPMIYTYWR